MAPRLGEVLGDRARLVTGAVLILFATLVVAVGGPLLTLAALVVATLGLYEYFTFAVGGGLWEQARHTLAVMLLPFGYWWSGFPGLVIGLACAAFSILLVQVFTVESSTHEPRFNTTVPAALMGIVYPGLPLTFLLILAATPGFKHYIAWLILIVAASDTFAYFGGRAFGSSKMAPRISPKKTWNGAYIGFASALIVAWWSARLLGLPLSGWQSIYFGSVVAIIAPLGDLVESLVKRIYDVKDSSQLLPGHGGVLDRIDALMFAAPVLFFVPLA